MTPIRIFASAADNLFLSAMSLEFPVTAVAHLNKHPFKGVLTRIDEPSDTAPNGSGGRLTVLTLAAAQEALPTLLGMGIGITDKFDGHNPQKKIGVITAANIVANAIEIEGYFYSRDFPGEMKVILANKARLGFSFELTPTRFSVTADNLFRIDGGVFTGAALLDKNKAAYKSTSLAAATETEEHDMTKEELEALMAAVAKVTTAVETQGAAITALQSSTSPTAIIAAAQAAIEPHAKALDVAAAALIAAGIGTDPTAGHAVLVGRIAADLRASAAAGRPAVAYTAGLPVAAAAATVNPELKALQDSIAALITQVKDLKAGGRSELPQPDRKTLPPGITAILARVGIEAGTDGKYPAHEVISAALKKANIEPEKRIEVLRGIERAQQGI